jgi:anti-sigma factor ChrR (cupin superfamily)
MGPIRRPSTTSVVEGALDETIAHLSHGDLTPQERAILIEARRLRSMIASWRAVPPRPAARKEVFANALQLFRKAGVGSVTIGESPADALGEAATPPATQGAAGETDTPPPAYSISPHVRVKRKPPSTPLLVVTPRDDIRPTPAALPAVVGAAGTRTSQPPSSSSRRVKLAPGVVLVRPSAMDWRPFPLIEGVTVKVLHRDVETGAFRALVHMNAGTELPRHRHSAPEEILLIDGSATIGEVEAHAGELCHAEADTVHEPIRTATGCTFFLVGSELDELVSPE